METAVHWEHFYEKHSSEVAKDSSQFAAFAIQFFRSTFSSLPSEQCSIMELGCGTGRDCRFFQSQCPDAQLYACDAATSSVKCTTSHFQDLPPAQRPTILHARFSQLSSLVDLLPAAFAVIYARFVIHAIAADEASLVLKWSADHLLPGGILCVEVRSVNDALYGKGSPVDGEADAFVCGHYRRFIRHRELEAMLAQLGLVLEYSAESLGWSKVGDDDPMLIRIIAKRPIAAASALSFDSSASAAPTTE